jgi:hypothetical protein
MAALPVRSKSFMAFPTAGSISRFPPAYRIALAGVTPGRRRQGFDLT